MVPGEDPAAFGDGIIRLLRDRTLANEIAEKGRRAVEENFDNNAVVGHVVEVYQAMTKPDAH